MTGSVMRTGGGGGISAEQVDEELEQFAGDVGIRSDANPVPHRSMCSARI